MEKINLFFAVDDNYCPFLSASLCSMFKNANKSYIYDIYVLHNGISNEKQEILKDQVNNFGSIEFVDMGVKIQELSDKLVTRDYFTLTTYYRLFIPNMFPNMDKALYLDSDIIIPGDISKLYNTDMGDNLVGAIPDMVIQNIPVFTDYVEKALDISKECYFNAGILLMNLKEMRAWDFENKFIELLDKYKFRVAQDQDYLNVLTKGRVKYIDYSWNVQPMVENFCYFTEINIVHYNMLLKPWIQDNIKYMEYFWYYAPQCPMYDEIIRIKNSISDEERENKEKGGLALVELAKTETSDPNNYKNKFCL